MQILNKNVHFNKHKQSPLLFLLIFLHQIWKSNWQTLTFNLNWSRFLLSSSSATVTRGKFLFLRANYFFKFSRLFSLRGNGVAGDRLVLVYALNFRGFHFLEIPDSAHRNTVSGLLGIWHCGNRAKIYWITFPGSIKTLMASCAPGMTSWNFFLFLFSFLEN